MRELTCIICPIGCRLLVEEGKSGSVPAEGFPALTVSGNSCPRGAVYAQEEIRAPKRVVTATCGVAFSADGSDERDRPVHGLTAPRRIPVKTSTACPRERIPELLGDIYRLRLGLPVKAGDRPITDWKGTGIDVVVVRSLG